NKKYVVDKLISDNGLENLKAKLAELLYGKDPIEERWDDFLKNVKGIGPSTISELLTYIDPERCMIFNKTTVLCYTYLKIPDMPKYNYQYTGKKYVEICNIAKEIASIMKASGLKETDMLAVDYFLWDEVLPLAEERELPESPISDTLDDIKPMNAKETKSLHDEIKEKLVDIGRMLGFESRSEVHISSGAVVDAV
ncbi:MAG TPA: hypothetical protein IAB09_01095, partial [Candidatus Avilachnospira avicola]|nr:hypothetical protein [Candidatus Avilachnospira avicola]